LYQRAYLANKVHEIEKEKAKLRQVERGESSSKQKTNRPKLGDLKPEEKLERARINREKRKQREANNPKPKKPRKKSDNPRDTKKEKKGKSRERAAKTAKLGEETLRQYQYVLKHGTPEIVVEMRKKIIKIVLDG
jgi:hypothetical protein